MASPIPIWCTLYPCATPKGMKPLFLLQWNAKAKLNSTELFCENKFLAFSQLWWVTKAQYLRNTFLALPHKTSPVPAPLLPKAGIVHPCLFLYYWASKRCFYQYFWEAFSQLETIFTIHRTWSFWLGKFRAHMGLCRKRFSTHWLHWEVVWGSSINKFERWEHLECMKLGDFSE